MVIGLEHRGCQPIVAKCDLVHETMIHPSVDGQLVIASCEMQRKHVQLSMMHARIRTKQIYSKEQRGGSEEEGDILLRLLHRRPLRAAVAELDGGEGRHHGGLQPVDPALHLNRS